MVELKHRIRLTCWNAGFLFLVFWIYIVVGGCVFKVLEHNPREEKVDEGVEHLEEERRTLLNVLWAQTIASSEEEWMEAANERIDLYETKLKNYLLQGIDLQDDHESSGGDEDNPWTFIGSIFYCYTVVTTIGYGNLAPATLTGKVLTIIYGTCGIPLTLVLLSELGKLLTLVLKQIYSLRNPDYIEDEDYESDEFSFTLKVSLALTIGFVVSSSAVFGYLEGWSWFDAAYFSFVTFSTIGFGDLVPDNQGWVLLTVAYSLTALSLMAMCVTALQVWLEDGLNDQRRRLEDWYERYKENRAALEHKKDDVTYTPNDAEEEEVEDAEIEEEDE